MKILAEGELVQRGTFENDPSTGKTSIRACFSNPPRKNVLFKNVSFKNWSTAMYKNTIFKSNKFI